MPKPVVCPTCSTKIPYGTINQDILDGFPRLGTPHPGPYAPVAVHADCASLDGVADRCFSRLGGWSGGEAWSAWPAWNATP